MSRIQNPTFLIRAITVGIGLTLAFGITTYHDVGASPGRTLGGKATSQGSDPWAQTERELRAEGQRSYADRSPSLQGIMGRMYMNDARYRTLLGLFIDRSPGDNPASLRVDIQQSGLVHTAAFNNVSGTGTPAEIYKGEGQNVTLYAPSHNVYTSFGRVVTNRGMDLSSVPLGVVQKEHSASSIYSGGFGGVVPVLADMFIHPAGVVTSPFFANKVVEISGKKVVAGRLAWKLTGLQVSGAPELGVLGDSWTMAVDVQTGIILRVDYYSGANHIGWAGFQDIQIDGLNYGGSSPDALAPSWAIPKTARLITNPSDYDRLAQP